MQVQSGQLKLAFLFLSCLGSDRQRPHPFSSLSLPLTLSKSLTAVSELPLSPLPLSVLRIVSQRPKRSWPGAPDAELTSSRAALWLVANKWAQLVDEPLEAEYWTTICAKFSCCSRVAIVWA